MILLYHLQREWEVRREVEGECDADELRDADCRDARLQSGRQQRRHSPTNEQRLLNSAPSIPLTSHPRREALDSEDSSMAQSINNHHKPELSNTRRRTRRQQQ